MTLDEINRVGELVTQTMDDDANVIWGARVTDDMKGKITVMTIITGVKSPWILGKLTSKQQVEARQQLSDELGIEIFS
jgi:cell division protein FtsZ